MASETLLPENFTQANRYLPYMNFRGYTQAMPLKYTTTVNPEFVDKKIGQLQADYRANQAGFETGADNFYKGLETAIGDVHHRNEILSSFDQAANSLLDKYKDNKGRISYESPEFQREARAMTRTFATNPDIAAFKETMEMKKFYDSASKDANVIDYNPYFNPEKGRYWDTKEDGFFKPDLVQRPNYVKPVQDLWATVKADVTKKDTMNAISGISTASEYESNKTKIDDLVDEVTDSFMKTDEGINMYRELTTPHMSNGEWIGKGDPRLLSPEEANAKIKEHVENLGELTKYYKTSNSKKVDLSWEEKANITNAGKKMYYDDKGQKQEAVTLPAGNEVTYTVSGQPFRNKQELDLLSSKYVENKNIIVKDFNSWAKSEGITGKVKYTTDKDGKPQFVLVNPNDKDMIHKYQSQLDSYSYHIQLAHNKIQYAKNFDEAAMKASKLGNMNPKDRIKMSQAIEKETSDFYKDGYSTFGSVRNGDVVSIHTLMTQNPALYKQYMEYNKTAGSDINAYKLMTPVNAFLKERGLPTLGVTSMNLEDPESITKSYKEVQADLNKRLDSSKNISKEYRDYLAFYDRHSQDKLVSDDVYSFIDKTAEQKSYKQNLSNDIISDIKTGSAKMYLRKGDQNTEMDWTAIKEKYQGAVKDGQKLEDNFYLRGWAFDNENGLVLVGNFEGQEVEFRGYTNIDSFLLGENYDVPFRLNMLKNLSEGFNESFDQESTLGVNYYDENGKLIQPSYKVEKLLFDEGAAKEGQLKVNFDGNIQYFDSYADAVQGYIDHVAKTQENKAGVMTSKDDSNYQIIPRRDGQKIVAADYGNPYGLMGSVNGVWGYRVFGSVEEGIKAGQEDIRTKVLGKSDEMIRKFGSDYLNKKEGSNAPATLLDLISVFAPSGDGTNNPANYAALVAGRLGVSATVPLKDLSGRLEELFKAMLKQENKDVHDSTYNE